MPASATEWQKSNKAGLLQARNFRKTCRLDTRVPRKSTSHLCESVAVWLDWETILPRTEALAGSTRRGRPRCGLRPSAFPRLAGGRRQTGRSLRKLLTDALAKRMEQGCGRFLQARGSVVRMLAQDRRYAQRLATVLARRAAASVSI
jgi:hypothetical protein